MKAIDMRSDAVTRPTDAMRAAMAAAPLGDDVFGDDPSVNALQEKNNLCAILSHCQRGDEYIVGQMQHCVDRLAEDHANAKRHADGLAGIPSLRFATHLDVDAVGIDRAIAAIRGFFKA